MTRSVAILVAAAATMFATAAARAMDGIVMEGGSTGTLQGNGWQRSLDFEELFVQRQERCRCRWWMADSCG